MGDGPIAQAVTTRQFDEVCLLSDYDEPTVAPYLKWLRRKTSTRVVLFHEPLSGPTQFGEIYEAALRGVKRALDDNPPDVA